jgi:hypothetical protein
MNRTLLSLATAAAAFAGAQFVFAAPFDSRVISDDPNMMFHVDCDAVRTSAIGQYILSQPEVQDQLAETGKLLDFDFQKQLHGITIYTTDARPHDPVMVVDADFEPDRLLKAGQTANDFLAVTNGSHVIYSWLDDKRKRREGGTERVYGAMAGRHVIFGQTEERVSDALTVIETKMHGTDGKTEIRPSASGAVILLEAALTKVDASKAQGPPAAFLKMAKSMYLKLTEGAGNTTAALRVEAADANSASQLNTMAQGLLGMLKLQSSDTNAAKFANSIAIKQEGDTVGVTLSMPSSEMVEMMKAGEEKGAQRRAQRRARMKEREKEKESGDKNPQPDNK